MEAWWGEFMPHGAGTGQHEPPYGDRDPACELREGMVLCIEPGVLVPGIAGVVHEQMVAAAHGGGAEVLNRLPLRMWRCPECGRWAWSICFTDEYRDHVRVFQSGWTL